MTLARPDKHLSPDWGQSVGGVSGRPARETRRSDPPTSPRRNGERHPDSQEADSLRGMSEQRESRPVRLSCVTGLFPYVRTHRRQRVSSGCPEEGNVVSVRQAHALDFADAKKRALRCSRTRPSLGPETRARQSPLNSSTSQEAEVARSIRYRGRANLRKQEEPAPRLSLPDAARSTACHRHRLRKNRCPA